MSGEGEALAERTRIIQATDEEIRNILQLAARDVTGILAAQPSDYQRWYLPQILAQIRAALERYGADAADEAGNEQSKAWGEGSRLVDVSLGEQAASADLTLSIALPVIDDAQLQAMSSFLTSKISNVTLASMDAINTQLGLVVIGAQSPWEAVKSVQSILQEDTAARASMIVRNELPRAYSVASQGRMMQWSDQVDGLQKEWLKSGKLHPRMQHVAMDGQIQPVDQPYHLPDGSTMMFPHDPAASAAQTINCGCTSVPRLAGYVSTRRASNNDWVRLADVAKR